MSALKALLYSLQYLLQGFFVPDNLEASEAALRRQWGEPPTIAEHAARDVSA